MPGGIHEVSHIYAGFYLGRKLNYRLNFFHKDLIIEAISVEQVLVVCSYQSIDPSHLRFQNYALDRLVLVMGDTVIS